MRRLISKTGIMIPKTNGKLKMIKMSPTILKQMTLKKVELFWSKQAIIITSTSTILSKMRRNLYSVQASTHSRNSTRALRSSS